MNYLNKIELNKVVHFDKASVPITDNNGLVIVTGENHDSMEPDNTNGAGKSLLFSSFCNAAYESSPLDGKLKKTHKDMLGVKGSTITLDFTSHTGAHVELTQTPSKYVVKENGDDLKIGKKSIAQDKLKQYLPVTEDEFYSYCYVQSQRPLKFQADDDLSRLKFVTEMFDLDVYDKIRKTLNDKRTEIAKRETEFQVFAGQLESVTRALKKLSWDKDKNKQLKASKSEIADLEKKVKKLYSKTAKLRNAYDDLKRVAKIQAKLDALDMESIESMETIEDLRTKIKAYDKYKEKLDNYKSLTSVMEGRIANLKEELGDRKEVSLEDLRGLYVTLEKKYKDAMQAARKVIEKENLEVDLKDEIKQVKAKLKKLGFKPTKKIKAEKVDIEALERCIELAEHLDDHKGTDCPTCGTSLDMKAIKAAAKVAEQTLAKHEKVRKAIKLNKQYQELCNDLKELGEVPDSEPLIKKAKKLEKELEGISGYGSILKELNKYREQLAEIKKPKKVKKPKSDYGLKELKRMESVHQENKSLLKQLKLLTGSTKGIDADAITSELKAADAKISKLEKKLNKKQSTYTSLNVDLKEYTLLKEQELEWNAKLEKIKPIVAEKDLITYLWKQFGATNLKLQAAGKILNLLEKSLNTYAPLIFSEPFKFNIRPSKKGISAIVIRPNGHVSDIRKLSGAETNCFRLLFAVALLPLVPAHKRLNFIILDEPDSACSPPVRQRMIKDFLPKLRSIVPHVFWITPQEIDSFPECKVWTVVKKGGKSKLKIK